MTGRIILFGPLPPPFGGVAVYMQALIKHLRGPNVRVWAYKGHGHPGSNIRFINHRRLGTFWALLREGRGARILDATHFHFEYPNSVLLPIWLLLKPFLGFKWYKNVLDGSLPRRHRSFTPLQRFWFRRALKSIDEFVVVGDELKDWLQNDLGIQQAITVVPCLLPPVIDEKTAELDSATESSLDKYLEANKRVCSIGVFMPEYGFRDVANAVEALRNQTSLDIQLLLLDGGFGRDEDYREQVVAGRSWITVIEKLANEKIPEILRRSDVFVRATSDEGYGISRVESIWSGTPVIATRAGETRGMLIYDFGDQEALVKHLNAVLFGSAEQETSEWAARYRQEAEQNLATLRSILETPSVNHFERIVMLTLSGDPASAREQLQTRYPGIAIEMVTRKQFEKGGGAQRVRMLRAMRPDTLAVVTERLDWQRGQNVFLLVGALAGARRTIILDTHGAWREEPRAKALIGAPGRLTREAATSAMTLRRAESELRQLEVDAETVIDWKALPQKGAHSENPNIVYLRSSPGPGTLPGGAASHLRGFLDAALQLGAQLSLISNDEIAGLKDPGIPVRIIRPKPLGSTRAAFDIYNNLHFTEKAAEEIEERTPDFIYQRYARFSWAGVAASLRSGRPLFLEYNGSEVWIGRYWDRVGKLDLLTRYERLNLKAAARVFVVSEVERRNLIRAGVDAGKIIVNPNGVDVERFRPDVGGDQLRRELGIAHDETLVGFVGTFGPWHGIEVLANAIVQIPKSAGLRFLLVGSGELRGRVEQILREGGVQDRVIMLGTVEHTQVARLLDACDVLVSPHVPLEDGSDFFGSPTKLFEYMAMGKGIVASRLGQIGEVLEHERNALLVEPGNVSELAEGITRLAASRELRDRLGAAARQDAVARYTWKHNAQRVIDEYRHWVKK